MTIYHTTKIEDCRECDFYVTASMPVERRKKFNRCVKSDRYFDLPPKVIPEWCEWRKQCQ